ncbi:ComEC family competence protein [Niabella sp. CC-SYL272]|uniref:ComEC/Rec2 family competence protein n=1 Tax=Niabella agricola TaxID=2891571 RepID=UPI001F32B272|nr:ComEC/Rec2 family competence protein [Niabella agricola]MCF3111212.1 ComEC family competence protein [Niabella agricola]
MLSSADLFLARAPFLKLLLPFAGGILLYMYRPVPVVGCAMGFLVSAAMVLLFRTIRGYRRLQLQWVEALLIAAVFVFLGMLITAAKDVRARGNWFQHQYRPGMYLHVTLLEQPVEKKRSYKAEAGVRHLLTHAGAETVSGRIILYFKKEPGIKRLRAGTQLIFSRKPQEIRNPGNPGAFDYKRYAFMNGITHQVYLTQKDIAVPVMQKESGVWLWLYRLRASILGILKKYIHGAKELGLAEALLIGYRDDLDKDLLQSYSDTGVVHVIAVSGMHLGLIYWLLDFLLSPLRKRRQTRWLHPVLVLGILWVFSLLAGAAASIVRAAVMFTCLLLGKQMGRSASVYNTLAASAFLLLCYNPYWLWDIGFQLSYAAVLSIVVFYKPLYHLITINNRLLDAVWQLCAVSIAAQVLTTPLSVYHFHQFPVYFLITNLLVVPVSSVVLIGELVLVLIAPVTPLAVFTGRILEGIIWWMNRMVETLSWYPFALWKGLVINIPQVLMLYIFITGAAVVCIQKQKQGLWAAALALCVIMGIRMVSFSRAMQQKQIIVYNIPRGAAVSFIRGRDQLLYADSLAIADPAVSRNVLQPAAVSYRLRSPETIETICKNDRLFFDGRPVLLVRTPLEDTVYGIADLVILSGNPRLYISDLLQRVQPRQIVIDGAVPGWKARRWQQDCDSLGIPCHQVLEKGAFVMSL